MDLAVPVSIPRNFRARLEEELQAKLTKAMTGDVLHPWIPSDFASLHTTVSQGSPLDTQLQSIIGERHLTEFMVSEYSSYYLSRPVATGAGLSTQKSGKPEEIAKFLLEQLESLPWNYTFYIPFPAKLPADILDDNQELKLTRSIKLILGSKIRTPIDRSSKYSLSELTIPSKILSGDHIYIEISSEGYIPNNIESNTSQDVVETLFSMLGLAIALDILTDKSSRLDQHQRPRFTVQALRWHASEPSFVGTIHLDEPHIQTLRSMGVYRNLWLGQSAPNAATLKSKLLALGKYLEGADEKLLSAARWYFDSYSGQNYQLRFVQVTTAFEVLLGDRSQGRETGLSTLMANRCAYMLGKNQEERNEIISQFRAGYEIRSSIVHTGKSKLTLKERQHFTTMQSLCALVLKNECNSIASSTT